MVFIKKQTPITRGLGQFRCGMTNPHCFKQHDALVRRLVLSTLAFNEGCQRPLGHLPIAHFPLSILFDPEVGVAGFEPTTLCSQSRCATKLRYTPLLTL